MKKIVLTWGLIAGAILGGSFFIAAPLWESTDVKNAELFGFITMFIGLSAVFFGIRAYRKQQTNNSLSFKKGFLVGLYITLIASFCYTIGWMGFYHGVGDNGTMDNYFKQQVEQVEQNPQLSAQEKETQLQEMVDFQEMYENNLVVMFGVTFAEIFPIGLIITLLSALILKKKPKALTN